MRKLLAMMAVTAMTLGGGGLARATNGLNMIAFGGPEAGMGGAAIGVSNNAAAMNNNPAGLTQVKRGQVTGGASWLRPWVKHEDALGNEEAGASRDLIWPQLACAHRIGQTPLVVGLGFFGQGGMVAEFENLTTAYGTVDQTACRVRYGKIIPAVAYQASERFSLGLSMNVGASDLEMKFLPQTVGPDGFYGFKLDNMYTFALSFRLGAQYKINDIVTLGAVFTTQSNLAYDHGKITFPGVGEFEAEMEGFNWPLEVGLGVGVKPIPGLLVAADVKYVNWSGAMDKVKIKTAAAAPLDEVSFTMEWRDQLVIALGAAYQVYDGLVVRGGYNFGSNPVPQDNLSPLFPAITEHHFTVGLGYRFSQNFSVDAAWEHALAHRIEYTNPEIPLGLEAVERQAQSTLTCLFTFTW